MTFAERVARYESSLDAELGAGWNAERAMLAAGEPDEPEHEIPPDMETQATVALTWAQYQLRTMLNGGNHAAR